VKTDASERTVPMVPALHETLLAARAARETHGGPAFPTRNGTRQHPDNVRSRLVASVRERANELLAERDQPVIGHMTPHTLEPFPTERLKGFEPSTFCMASRDCSDSDDPDIPAKRAFRCREQPLTMPVFHREITGVWGLKADWPKAPG
jgi:hypothetical protein